MQLILHSFILQFVVYPVTMMEQQLATGRLAPDQLDSLPAELDSPQAKLVYLYLDATGGTTVADLKKTLSLRKMAILSVLRTLSKQELVEKNGATYAPVA